MNVVIAGGGMIGLTLGRLLRARGVEPIIIERMPEGAYMTSSSPVGFALALAIPIIVVVVVLYCLAHSATYD